MNLIREVKTRADIVKVAELYNIELNRTYKCKCPFHEEKTASFSISPSKQIWKCFGCGKGGDVISLVAELLNINSLEAAKSINKKLGLGLETGKTNSFEINRYKTKKDIEEKFKKWELETFVLITDYLSLLNSWKKIQDIDNELYIEALQQIEYTKYVIDEIFLNGSSDDKIWFWKNERKWVKRIESRVRTFRTTNE